MSALSQPRGSEYVQDGPAARGRATFNYKQNANMSEDMKEVMAMFDHDKTGQVTTSDLIAAAQAHEEMRGQNKMMWKIVKVLLVTLVATLACVFGLTVAAIELSKETTVSGQVLVTPAGQPVQVAAQGIAGGCRGVGGWVVGGGWGEGGEGEGPGVPRNAGWLHFGAPRSGTRRVRS
jgi:hypothetical protein